MRVIAGEVKGHKLKSPRGNRTRPTTGLVRGAIFSMLEQIARSRSRVLDLYAGTGALGIEALSRGAQWVDYVEQNPRCCAIIKENLNRTGLSAKAKVHCQHVAKALPRLCGTYDVIFIDPPYSDLSLNMLLHRLALSKLVDKNSTIVVQHSSHTPLASAYGKFQLLKSRRYGETCLSIYQQEEEVDNCSLSRQL